jgi:hypothetical protein
MELLLKLNGDKMQGMAIYWPIYFNKEATGQLVDLVSQY